MLPSPTADHDTTPTASPTATATSSGPSTIHLPVTLEGSSFVLASPVVSPGLLRHGAGPGRSFEVQRREALVGPAWSDPQALKIVVDRDGPVAITGAALEAAGWSLGEIDPRAISLSEQGEHRPLWIETGDDGRLDPEDGLWFHGRAMTGEYTRERVYWLRRQASQAPPVRTVLPPDASASTGPYTATMRWEEDTVYVASQPAAEGPDRWMWGAALSAPATRTLQLRLPPNAARAPGRLSVALQGYTNDPQVSGDHHVRLLWDGVAVADRIFEGRGTHRVSAAIGEDQLSPGDHSLQVLSLGDTGARVDVLFLDHVALELGARTELVDGRILFRPPHDARAGELAAYSLSDVEEMQGLRVWDVSDPDLPVALSGLTFGREEGGRSVLRFVDRVSAELAYIAFHPSAALPPARIEPNLASSWREQSTGADWIAISHGAFLPEVERLAAHRRERGLRTAVVDVADVYDEFSGGVYDPAAIRAFVDHAWRDWPRPAPRFLLLVGSATLDHRGGYGPSNRRFVPAPRVEIATGGPLATVTSDTWYALLQGDDPVPELGVGRLPVSSAHEARIVVDKILDYETRAASGAPQHWRRTTLWVADDGAAAFESLNSQLIDVLPPEHEARRFDAGRYDRQRDLSADLRTSIEEGALAIHYTGHGNVDLWSPWPGGGTIFANHDIVQLRNSEALPVLTSATCMNGFIDNPVKQISMAEHWLVQEGGGGIAAWAPSGFTGISVQDTLLGTFYAGLHDGRGRPLGDITRESSRAAWSAWPSGGDIIRMFVLIGDPATVVASDPAPSTDGLLYLPVLDATDAP